ncbi:hypothetical protein LS73_001190 [Helicobacter muridarum]|uniref:Uncharacterized protein n=1 Tax=Helicobacter muridarum TaxID=216 RepID=A0A099TYV8_9HELI|nr:prepilin-type N-terminal cleavage/methylation domain-containing protein [Helicobacter muridarum]TLE01330.1 hypothetical protein LS73_001190 [Helicobacter muridarum]STQ85249.1 Uncharacterised protein [Helicobacter muridarum]
MKILILSENKFITSLRYVNADYKLAFSLFELLVCLFIISILSIPAVNYARSHLIAIEKARLHIRSIQNNLAKLPYKQFISKQDVTKCVDKILKDLVVDNKFFSLKPRGRNQFRLYIGKQYVQFTLNKSDGNRFNLSCNPSQFLCRKIYHRKHLK